MKIRYLNLKRNNLPIFGFNKDTLKDHTTTENDMKKGVTKFPAATNRLPREDLLSSSDLSAGSVRKDSVVL